MGKGILPCPAACTSPARLAFPWFQFPRARIQMNGWKQRNINGVLALPSKSLVAFFPPPPRFCLGRMFLEMCPKGQSSQETINDAGRHESQRGPQEHSSSAQASQRSSHDPSAFWPLVLSERAESKSEAQPLAATCTLRPIRPNRELMARGAMICQLALAGIPTWPPFFLSSCPEPILGQWLSRFHRPA